MPGGDTARLLHRLTSYAPGQPFPAPLTGHPLLVQDYEPNDDARFPGAYKDYDLPRVPLPREWPLDPTPATAVLARGGPAMANDVTSLARVLHLSAGVVRTTGEPKVLFRAAGSSGGCFPLELYVSARGVEGIVDGVHWYDPEAHALVRIAPPARSGDTTLIVTGVPFRTGWRYVERGFRHLYWDAGTMLAQALAVSGGRLLSRFPDAQVTRLVGADGTHEFPLALVTLGEPAIEPTGEAAAGDVRAELEFPLITQAQRAGDLEALGEPWPLGDPIQAPLSPDLEAVILQRGSCRRMDATATIPRATYEFALQSALRGIDVPHYAIVHGVEGLESGLYRDGELRRAGNLREEALWLAWSQGIARDAAFDVFGATDLARLDDRGYREAQLAAGIVAGRLHLAAYALGLGASGMTFLDSEVEAFLGEPLGGLLMTCVGVPAYRNRRGGRPGEPVDVVAPRIPA